jgi:hypothetical protein
MVSTAPALAGIARPGKSPPRAPVSQSIENVLEASALSPGHVVAALQRGYEFSWRSHVAPVLTETGDKKRIRAIAPARTAQALRAG